MKNKVSIAIFSFILNSALPNLLAAADKDRWEGVFYSPKGMVLSTPDDPRANRRGEIINDPDFILETLSKVFKSEKDFQEQWYRAEALTEYYFALSPLVDSALAPLIIELRDSLTEMEAARLNFQVAARAWEDGKPYSESEIIEPLSQLRESASLLAVSAQRRIRALKGFENLSIPIENVQSWYDRIDDEEREQLIEEEVNAYEKILNFNETHIPNWRKAGQLTAVMKIIPVLFWYRIQVLNWLEKVDQVHFVLSNWFMEKVDEIRHIFEEEHEWLLRIMPTQDLKELEKKLDVDLRIHLDESLPETEPNYYFNPDNFEKELKLAEEAAQAPAWVSTLVLKISDQANAALLAQLDDLRTSLPFDDPAIELMDPQEAEYFNQHLRDLWWFQNLPYRMNFLSSKDLKKVKSASEQLGAKAANLKLDYEATFLDPESDYQRDLRIRIEDEVKAYQTHLTLQQNRNQAELELIAAEAILREEVRQRHYNRAWAVLLWMRDHLAWLQAQGAFVNADSLAEHLNHYEAYILESNTRAEWVLLLNEMANAARILSSSSDAGRQHLGLRSMELLERENLWLRVDEASFRMELEAQHTELIAALSLEAREKLMGGRK